MHRDAVKEKIAAAKQFLRVYHREHPLAAGCNKEELRSRVLPKAPPPVFEQLLSLDEDFVISGEFTRLNFHKITMQAEEQDASARMEAAFAGAGLQVPSLAEVLNSSGVDRISRAHSPATAFKGTQAHQGLGGSRIPCLRLGKDQSYALAT